MRNTERTSTPIPTDDQALLARLQSGDERALADLADAYSSKIYQLAFRYLRNKEDAEDHAGCLSRLPPVDAFQRRRAAAS
jgi:hypothetical protein